MGPLPHRGYGEPRYIINIQPRYIPPTQLRYIIGIRVFEMACFS